MKTLTMGIALAVFGAAHASAATGLRAQVTHEDGWVAWQVPMVAGAGAPCCFTWRRGTVADGGCNLDGRDWSFGTGSKHALDDSMLAVYAHVVRGRIDRVRAVAAACPVESKDAIRRIAPVAPAQSVALLSDWLAGSDGKPHDDEPALAALAYHEDASATHALAAQAGPKHDEEARAQALFWLGQTRGVEGADIVEHYATTDADPDLREKAVFALSQSKAGDPYARILSISRSDRTAHVRSQALFWMAQTEDARASADITAALANEASDDVREQAVFALSQLKDGQAEDALIAIVRGNYPRDAKKQALFWLGQSGSPRAIQALDDVLAAGGPAR
jgi:hypothetical protein